MKNNDDYQSRFLLLPNKSVLHPDAPAISQLARVTSHVIAEVNGVKVKHTFSCYYFTWPLVLWPIKDEKLAKIKFDGMDVSYHGPRYGQIRYPTGNYIKVHMNPNDLCVGFSSIRMPSLTRPTFNRFVDWVREQALFIGE